MKDIVLKQTLEGLDFVFQNDVPLVSGSLDNAVYFSLFTSDWWGNSFSGSDEKYDSSIPEIMGRSLLTNQTRLNIIEATKNSLQWMTSQGITCKIEVGASIPSASILLLEINLYEPNRKNPLDFICSLNWDDQKIRIMEAL